MPQYIFELVSADDIKDDLRKISYNNTVWADDMPSDRSEAEDSLCYFVQDENDSNEYTD